MTGQARSIFSLTSVVLLGLTLASDANAETPWGQQRTDEQIQTCVAEIGKHANYSNASRVIHRVTELDQRNLIELVIRVETSVYGLDDAAVVTEYSASCTTETMGDLVNFRINAARHDERGDRHYDHS